MSEVHIEADGSMRFELKGTVTLADDLSLDLAPWVADDQALWATALGRRLAFFGEEEMRRLSDEVAARMRRDLREMGLVGDEANADADVQALRERMACRIADGKVWPPSDQLCEAGFVAGDELRVCVDAAGGLWVMGGIHGSNGSSET